MKLILFALIIVGGVVALGFYRGWFDLSSAGADGQSHITLTVDQNKIKADEKRAQEALPAIGTTATPSPAAPSVPAKN
ncbi:MAG: hypothetical protein ACJ8C4_03660 [Gemmataceae bacterium]